MKKTSIKIIILILTFVGCDLAGFAKMPDIETIKFETQNPLSPNYYPTLLKTFLSKDETLLKEQYPYFYYGTLFQEDYNPYREEPNQQLIKATEPLYSRHGNLQKSEKEQILNTANAVLANNPLNLVQLSHMVYAWEQLGKVNTAALWKDKLDNIMLTISQSGSGADRDNAIIIVDPAHEFDYFNIAGITVENQEFVEPYYEVVTVTMPGEQDKRKFWFNILYILEQYYAKHPEELTD